MATSSSPFPPDPGDNSDDRAIGRLEGTVYGLTALLTSIQTDLAALRDVPADLRNLSEKLEKIEAESADTRKWLLIIGVVTLGQALIG